MVTRVGSLNPAAFPDEEFELYSIPAHDHGGPELAKGIDIGSSKQLVRAGDVVISKIIPHIRRARVIGESNGRRQIASGEWIVFRGNCFDSSYLRQFLLSDGFHGRFMNTVAGVGGSLVRARPQYVKSIAVPLPPLEEQRRIAAILDQADAIRVKRRQVLAHLDSLAQSIFHDMFGDPQNWPLKWNMGVVADMAESVNYGTSAKAGSSGDWPILRMGNVTDAGRLDLNDLKYIDLAASDVPKFTVRRGDLLFNRTNSMEHVGKSCVVTSDAPLAFAGYLIRVRLRAQHSSDFLSAYLASPFGRSVRKKVAKPAVNQANISASELRALRIALPPSNLQREFSSRVEQINFHRATIERALAADDMLFSSLQSRAFKGEL
jgi:type I restriction enzyme S subunit